jgi:peptidoglycan hydrolase CwlO-like protein
LGPTLLGCMWNTECKKRITGLTVQRICYERRSQVRIGAKTKSLVCCSKAQEKKASIEASVADLTDNLKAMQAKRKEKETEINAKGDELKTLNKKIENLRNASRIMD